MGPAPAVGVSALAARGPRREENLMPLVLLYHDVVDDDDDASGFPGGDAARYKLGRREFAQHLDAIGAASATVADLCRAESVPDGKGPLFTFDDGGVSAATIIADELERRGCRGHFFITVDYIGRPGFVSRAQIVDLARRGHDIGSHSCSHPTRMAMCSRHRLLDEWRRSREVLAEILGAPVTNASVPGGYYSRAVAETAGAVGITHLFNSEPTTRVVTVDDCQVIGRYSIYRGMTAAQAAALASGSRAALLQQAVAWKLKKALKAVGGRAYLGVRKMVLDRLYRPKPPTPNQ
jgi:peptidoglycan/xylan/chitin deacetylase (PgdA/CDA1 family)